MPYRSGIEGFVAKRTVIYMVILSLFNIILIEKRWLVLLGIFLGGIFSIIKFYSLSALVTAVLNKNSVAVKSILGYVLNFAVMIMLMASSLLLNLWFGAGIIAGILMVPFVILTNNLTESLGITHNNYDQERR